MESVLDPPVDLKLALEHGLTEEEYEWVVAELGRQPTFVELGIYSVMWSEHCSYKNSIAVLKTLPREGDALLVGAGEENAGLVDVGEGLAVAFKIESHNHPSAVEPYQGAATGVGGIQRDIFTMGARPICSLNSLRFGRLSSPRVRYLFDGVVRGIGDYGNSFGVPTVAGEVYFDEAYEDNPLVNAMSVGLAKVGQTASAIASGTGNAVYIVGSSTGRDGIHGATFASEEISEQSEDRRPAVQVGDPFMEKLLLEATLEAIGCGGVVGIQDMGAAGLTCSSCEMSAKGKSGMIIHADLVPVREKDMNPYEIMLSESQERMLVVVDQGREKEIEAIFEKWDLAVARIGEVTDDERVRVLWHGEVVANVRADHLVLGGGAPVYYRDKKRPDYLNKTRGVDLDSIPDLKPEEVQTILGKLLAAPNIASKRWVFEQYDTSVRTNTVVSSGPSDAAVVRIKGSDRGLAVKTDCNGRYVYLNPRRGGQIAVAEAARNVVCAGGKPVAITNCLNFGNPYKPEMYWVFEEAVAGMGEACRSLDTPVTGGNVSFYNESPTRAVYPTPTIGMLGVVDNVERDATDCAFKAAGDKIVLITPASWIHKPGIGGTEYLAEIHGKVAGDTPHLDLGEESAVQEFTLAAIRSGAVASAHDVSDGGLLVALAECCIFGDVGATVALGNIQRLRLDALLFGEAQSRVILTCNDPGLTQLRLLAEGSAAEIHEIGVVEGNSLALSIDDKMVLNAPVATLSQLYERTIPTAMGGSGRA